MYPSSSKLIIDFANFFLTFESDAFPSLSVGASLYASSKSSQRFITGKSSKGDLREYCLMKSEMLWKSEKEGEV